MHHATIRFDLQAQPDSAESGWLRWVRKSQEKGLKTFAAGSVHQWLGVICMEPVNYPRR